MPPSIQLNFPENDHPSQSALQTTLADFLFVQSTEGQTVSIILCLANALCTGLAIHNSVLIYKRSVQKNKFNFIEDCIPYSGENAEQHI